MTNSGKALCWFFFGPPASVLLGYSAFLFFGVAFGSGLDIDHRATAAQEFLGAFALPALMLFPTAGTLFSFLKAWHLLRLR